MRRIDESGRAIFARIVHVRGSPGSLFYVVIKLRSEEGLIEVAEEHKKLSWFLELLPFIKWFVGESSVK